jgi:hypothetical protein
MKLNRIMLLAPVLLLVGCTGGRHATSPTSTSVSQQSAPTAAIDTSTPEIDAVPSTIELQPPTLIDQAFFQRADLLYGSTLGAWTLQDGRYDGHYMLNYKESCPTCPDLARAAKIPVISWGVWDAFSDQVNPGGQPGTMTVPQFNNVIDGIRNTLGAYPFVRLQPNDNANTFCPSRWGVDNLLAMNKEVIRTAGNRVQLYELTSEPELACGLDPSVAGTDIGQYWLQVVPQLKKYARSLGFEIYIGGPGTTTTHTNNKADTTDLQMLHDFMQTIRTEYTNPSSPYYHDPDAIPDFVSFHMYGIEYVNMMGGEGTPLDAIPHYGVFLDSVQSMITHIWGDVAPHMKMVVSEWNVGAEGFTFPEPLSATFYTQFLQMLRKHNVFMANQFLLASDNNAMDMITEAGATTPYYEAFKQQSLTDSVANRSRASLAVLPQPLGTAAP